MMDVLKMTRKDFEALPHRKWDERIECTSLIILPMRTCHDSGFRYMDFVAVKDNDAVCLLSGCSYVIHVDRIGGYVLNWIEQGYVPSLVLPSGWSIDCLPVSGLLRMWPQSGKMLCGEALSSFEIYALPNDESQ